MDESRQETKDALRELIDNAINDSKKELDGKRDYLQESKEAIAALKELSMAKKDSSSIINIIQAVVAVLVVVLSVGGSWYNSKIETNEFFNELRHLKVDMEKMEDRVKTVEVSRYENESNYRLLSQRVDLLIKDIDKKTNK